MKEIKITVKEFAEKIQLRQIAADAEAIEAEAIRAENRIQTLVQVKNKS